MSSSNIPLPAVGGDGDVWIRNAALIRQLYISERKTLKQVKEVLESQHGFPTFPLSTYETKLRDKLKLRKKLKKADWAAVYQHFRNRGGRETGIYLNGMRISWDRAWKEIRRSGSRLASNGQLRGLPAGVVVRSPSPEMRATPPLFPPLPSTVSSPAVPTGTQPASANTRLQGSIPEIATVSSHDSITPLSTPPHMGATGVVRRASAVSNNFNILFHRVYLENIPMNTFRKHLHLIISNGLQGPHNSGVGSDTHFDVAILGDIMDFVLGLNFRMSSSIISFQEFEYSSSMPALNFDSYHFLTRAIYLLSNKIIAWNNSHMDDTGKLFDILLARLHERVLLHFLQSDLPTARAALETLVPFAYERGLKDAFIFLLRVGLERPDWILDNGHTYLSMAASLGSLDTIHCLLRIGARVDDRLKYSNPLPSFPSAILEAVGVKSMACAEALIHGCDVNRIISRQLVPPETTPRELSNFGLFFSAMGEAGAWLVKYNEVLPDRHLQDRVLVNLSLDNEMHSQVLGMFLDHGADVDSIWDGRSSRTHISRLHTKNRVSSKSKLSFLDQSYYWDTRLYAKLSPYSFKEATRITRPGICLSAKRGKEFLQAYLDSRPAQHPADRVRFLELVLAEQFFMEDFNIDTQVVQGLIDFGVDIKLPTMITNFSALLCRLVSKAARFGFTDTVHSLFNLLIFEGAVLDHVVVNAAVAKTGLGALPKLVNYGVNIQEYGASALCSAARFNNFEAVSWLLHAGVNINAGLPTRFGIKTIIAYSSLTVGFRPFDRYPSWRDRGTETSIEMLAYLIGHGARLRLSPHDSSSYGFLQAIMRTPTGNHTSTQKKIKFFLDLANCSKDLATDQESLLASWNPGYYYQRGTAATHPSCEIYELLLERGCPIQRECQLAFFIDYGGRLEVVYKLLNAGADVNAYSESRTLKSLYVKQYPIQAAARRGCMELLSQLLKRGANINQPAIGLGGRTALQSACELTAQSTGYQTHKLGWIKNLIDLGADVNAPAAKYWGMTALQIAASHGDMGTVLLLLEHGANINAPPAKHGGYCALDAAARNGRLDTVQLLLSVAAHSHHRGRTGYEGAVRLALQSRHYAVAELIREQVINFGNCIIVNLEANNPAIVPDDSSASSDDGNEDEAYYTYDSD
ncbi:hypothetical protein F5B21DRAFT_477277 [Xylaria acuta]|nr:hypothetical protein F5B21DRAFT_477277 [Xylaria acuta]